VRAQRIASGLNSIALEGICRLLDLEMERETDSRLTLKNRQYVYFFAAATETATFFGEVESPPFSG
jgi:hypothetical protein